MISFGDRPLQVTNFTVGILRSNVIKVMLSVGCTLLIGVLSGSSLVVLLPLLSSTGIAQSQSQQSKVFMLADSLWQGLGLSFTIYTSLVLYVVLTIVQSILGFARTQLDTRIVQEFKKNLRDTLFAAIFSAEWRFVKQEKNTHLFNNLIGEINKIGYSIMALVSALSLLLIFCFYLVASLFISVKMTVLALLCFLPLLLIQKKLNTNAYKVGEVMYWRHESLFTTVLDFINSFKLAKSHTIEQQYVSTFRRLTSDIAEDEYTYARTGAYTDFLYQAGTALSTCVILVGAIRFLHIPVIDLLVMVFIASRLIPNFSSLARNYQYILSTLPAYTGVTDLLRKAQSNREEDNAQKVSLQSPPTQAIRFNKVDFSYDQDTPIFNQFTYELPINKTTSIIGVSGRGKTTLVELILGLQKPRAGEIFIDSIDLAHINQKDWRSMIAYIPQESFLFNATIRQNLLWVNPDASDEALHTALCSAACSFVFDLPEGLDTLVGDQGGRLSGGERQRLALARALLRHPRLLILDEATNALDANNEKLIKDALEQIKHKTTILIIAHNPYLHELADQTLVI
ncbi:ATP-binding cassette domain-containing protein [Spirosoma aerophilum]